MTLPHGREGYALAAGLALGLVTLGRGRAAVGLARGLLRTTSRPTLISSSSSAPVCAFTLKVSQAPISVEGKSDSDLGRVLVLNDPAGWRTCGSPSGCAITSGAALTTRADFSTAAAPVSAVVAAVPAAAVVVAGSGGGAPERGAGSRRTGWSSVTWGG